MNGGQWVTMHAEYHAKLLNVKPLFGAASGSALYIFCVPGMQDTSVLSFIFLTSGFIKESIG